MAISINLRNPRHWFDILPDFIRLLWRVVRDERVSPWVRGGLVGVVGYLVIPVDIVPDWVPFAGQVDDLLVLTIGTRMLLRRIPEAILLEHWSGEPETLGELLGRPVT